MKRVFLWRPDVIVVSLWAVIVGGAIVRLVGLTFGFPFRVHPDEPIVVEGALGMLERNSFEPTMFQWPNHLGIMATYLAYVVLTPVVHGMSAEQAAVDVEVTYFYLVARLVTAAFGLAGIVLSYFIGRFFARTAGLLAAAFVAFFPPYVEHSHYATSDVILTTTVLFVVFVGMAYIRRPSVQILLLMSLGAAFAVMTKYPGALVTLVIAASVIAAAVRDRKWLRILRHGLLSLSASLGFLFILSPALFTNRGQVIQALTRESRSTHLGADGFTFVEKLIFYAGTYFSATGLILLGLTVLGVVYVVKSKQLIALPVFVGIVFWLALSTLGLHWERWGLPMFVTPLLLAAIGGWALLSRVRNRQLLKGWTRVALHVVLGFALVTQVSSSIAISATLIRPDSRVVAYEGAIRLGATPENTVSEGYTPFRPGRPGTVFDEFIVQDGRLLPLNANVRYVALSSFMVGRFAAEDKYLPEQEFYELLKDQYALVAEYGQENEMLSSQLGGLRFVSSVRDIAETARGGTTGPRVLLFEVPTDSGP